MRLRVIWKDGWAHIHGTDPSGSRIRRALGTRDALQAEEARAAFEARIWRESIYGAKAVVTFEEIALAYVKDGGEARFVLPISKHFAKRLATSIAPADIRDAARKLHPLAKPSTLNRQVIVPARAIINFGAKNGLCDAIKIESFRVEQPRREAVSGGYLAALRPHLPDALFALMVFLQTTGRRVGDAIGLDVQDVDLASRTARIGRTKNGDPALVHFPQITADLMRAIMPKSGSVFGYAARSSLYPTIRRACAKAKVPYLGTHQPGRHTFATALDAAGFSVAAIADAGGWKSRAMVQAYVHPDEAAKKASATLARFTKKRG